ncbi:MAG: 3-oxo-tetronate kinase [Pseudonocardiaceae bacterium]
MPVQFSPFGCIADDLTGAVDLATRFRHAGFRVHLQFQVSGSPPAPKADVLIVGLKSRMKPIEVAVAESLAALDWLVDQGCAQFYLKYASTFDCTRFGNIGPVIEAVMSRLDVDFTVACPALPSAGRITRGGKHFVDGVPLGESYMRNHPLTPMTNSHLVSVLQNQAIRRVGHLPHSTVTQGSPAIRRGLNQLRQDRYAIAVLDTVTDGDLKVISSACNDTRLTTGASGLALALMHHRERIDTNPQPTPAYFLRQKYGKQAIISGSCSEVTRRQLAVAAREYPAMQISPLDIAAGKDVVGEVLSWASDHLVDGPIVIFSTTTPDAIEKIHGQLGRHRAAHFIEDTLAAIANGLASLGVLQMIVAGGETSGAVAESLGIQTLDLGPTIDSGVSWTFAKARFLGDQNVALALKPGNFGKPNLFSRAWEVLEESLREPSVHECIPPL